MTQTGHLTRRRVATDDVTTFARVGPMALFDHLIGERAAAMGLRAPAPWRGFQVDDEIELIGSSDRQVGGHPRH